MQATARRLSVVSATSCARRRLIRDVRPTDSAYLEMTRGLISFALVAVVTAAAPSAEPPSETELNRLRQEDAEKGVLSFAEVSRLLRLVPHDAAPQVYEGLPHQSQQRKTFTVELTKSPVIRHSFWFYRLALPVEVEHQAILARLLSEPSSFRKFSGPKKCGGYHPDYAVVWKIGEAELEFHFCRGCHEARIYGGGSQIYVDLDEAAYLALEELWPTYAINRPRKTLERPSIKEAIR